MKKYIFLLGLISIMLIVGMTFIGCGKGGGSPSSVVTQLHTAIEKGNAKAISDLTTPEAGQIINMFGEKAGGMLAEKGGIERTEETIDGDEAVVRVFYKDGDYDDYDLVKIDGKWKVAIEK